MRLPLNSCCSDSGFEERFLNSLSLKPSLDFFLHALVSSNHHHQLLEPATDLVSNFMWHVNHFSLTSVHQLLTTVVVVKRQL